jgi:addiction module HigA family antidote
MAENKLNPIHPGEVLLEEFLKPMELSQNRLAIEIEVHARWINEIVVGKRRVTADTALRLARFFWHIAAILDGVAERLRFGCCPRSIGRPIAKRSPQVYLCGIARSLGDQQV